MKSKIIKILEKPTVVVISTAVLAIVIGFLITVSHAHTIANRFAGLDVAVGATSTSTLSQDLVLAFPVGGRIKSVVVKTGDVVKKGDVLASLDAENALGAINQAKGAYSAAQTAYDKLLNGASTPDIDVAKVALDNAKTAYTNIVSQQQTLVSNAFGAMMSSGLTAVSTISGSSSVVPTISGTYTGTTEGTYSVRTYGTGAGVYYSVTGLETGDYPTRTTPSPLGTEGLYIAFPDSISAGGSWTISIPNKQSANYVTLNNAYTSALQTQAQAVSNAQGAVDTAQAALNQKLAAARSEDLDIAKAQVESTQGALQIAEGAYNNTLIIAPTDGTITNVSIVVGQIATANTPAIELLSQ